MRSGAGGVASEGGVVQQLEKLLPAVCDLAKQAGREILSYFRQNHLIVTHKSDHSPVTQADLASHRIILSGLKAISDSPIISEESTHTHDCGKIGRQFWLVDPLDGTKEFIKGSCEFTVNIAFIQNGDLVLGVIYAPALETLYFGAKNIGAFRQLKNAAPEKLPLQSYLETSDYLRVAISASHADSKTDFFVKKFSRHFDKPIQLIQKGSSLKIALLATGEIDIYPRLGPTKEWDIAAGHAILRCTGGELYDLNTRAPLAYNKNNLLNSSFVGASFSCKQWVLMASKDCFYF